MANYLAVLLGLCLSLPAFALKPHPILMVCTGNTGRSPMAEAIANDLLAYPRLGYPAFSRGIHVNPHKTAREANAIIVMQALNVNIAAGHAQPITKADIAKSYWVLTMTEAQKLNVIALDPLAATKVLTLSECAIGQNDDILDAYGRDLTVYRNTREQITHYLQLIKAHHFTCRV